MRKVKTVFAAVPVDVDNPKARDITSQNAV